MISRKDMNALAGVLAEARAFAHCPEDVDGVASLIGDVIADANPRFDRERWEAACLVDPNPVTGPVGADPRFEQVV